jgi:hypothetical protein
MSQWDYCHVAFTSTDEHGEPRIVHFDGLGRTFDKTGLGIMEYLNELGNESWEFVSVTDFRGASGGLAAGVSYYLKRPR